jgi:hypothetical protein
MKARNEHQGRKDWTTEKEHLGRKGCIMVAQDRHLGRKDWITEAKDQHLGRKDWTMKAR